MPPLTLPTTPAAPADTQLLIAAWTLGGVGIYLVLVVIILLIRQCFVSQGLCADCNCCGKNPDDTSACDTFCGDCLQLCSCTAPSLNSCCDSICGQRKRYDFDDCISLNCCGDGGGCGQMPAYEGPACPSCPSCNCTSPNCDEIVCCCIRISVMSTQAT